VTTQPEPCIVPLTDINDGSGDLQIALPDELVDTLVLREGDQLQFSLKTKLVIEKINPNL